MTTTLYYRICRECEKPSEATAKVCEHCQHAMPPVEIFLSYAHEDEKLLGELNKHLKILQRTGIGMTWYDQNISKGLEWSKELHFRLRTADIILLLISSDFIASDFCYSKEMDLAMKRHQSNEACVIPVIMRPTSWSNAPFGILQASPKDAEPITKWNNRDSAFLNVTNDIEKVIKGRFGIAIKKDSLW